MPESASQTPDPAPPPEQGRFLKMPYDLSQPTAERVRARLWNRHDRRLFTPKAYGWGYDINFYWLAHPVQRFRTRS